MPKFVSMLAAAPPWTYWMFVPLLVTGLLGVVAVLLGYYHRILVPRYRWTLYEAELQRRSVTPLPRRAAPPAGELRQAA